MHTTLQNEQTKKKEGKTAVWLVESLFSLNRCTEQKQWGISLKRVVPKKAIAVLL